MKKLNLFYLLTLLLVFASCSNSDDSKSETKLTVSVNDLILEAVEGSYSPVPLVITASDDWQIVSYVDWLDFSSKSGGAGSVQVAVRAKKANDSSEERVGEFDVKCGDKVKTITVRQLPGLADGCVVYPTDFVILTNSVAFDFDFGKKVSYYYYGYIQKDAIGSMTDDEIAEFAQSSFRRYTPEDNKLGYLGGLNANTEYYLVTFAYDSRGYRGEMIKTLIRTQPTVIDRPSVKISDVTYNSSAWYWTTTMSPYTKKYYQDQYSGEAALLQMYEIIDDYVYELPDAVRAWKMKKAISAGILKPILNSSYEWSCPRVYYEVDFLVYTWAVGDNDEFAYELDSFWGGISEDAVLSPMATRAAKGPFAGVTSK